jgi:capsular polysaccharide biosynthesis protein
MIKLGHRVILHRKANIVSTEKFVSANDLGEFTSRERERDALPDKKGQRIGFSFVSALDLAAGLNRDPSIEVSIAGTAGLRELTRPGPSFHDDPDEARLFSSLGAGSLAQSPAFTVTASRLRLVGYRSYLSPNGLLFNDEAIVNEAEVDRFMAGLSKDTPFENESTGLVPTDQARLFTLSTRNRPVERLQGEIVSLCSLEPENYGAFLMRVLPKIAGRRCLLRGRRVIGPLYSASMRDFYAMAGYPVDQMLKHNNNVIYDFENAIIPSNRNPYFLLDSETLAFYAELRERFGTCRKPRKIFVSRFGLTGSYAATHRVMLNEEQLVPRLVAEGFDVVRPHAMTARQQIEAFSSAELIVGASGSAMFNVVFSHPGTKVVDIESEPHWIFAHLNLFGSCGLDYGIFEAKARNQDWSAPHQPFAVNVDALMTRISSM